MQRKNFLFERSDLDQPTSTVLFKKWEFEKEEFSTSSTNLLSQFNLSRTLGENTNILPFYTTPPMEMKIASMPKAPIKQKKLPRKGDLKPKKLQYSDEESEVSTAVDSGINFESIHSNNTLFSKQHTAKYNRFDSSQKCTRRLRPMLDKIKGQTNDKENDKNIVNHRSTNTLNSRNNLGQTSSVVFNSNTKMFSDHNDNYDWKDKLYSLQPQRDIGLWVQCCRKECHKFRYVDNYHDPTDVPKKWFCEMNSDKSIASCNIPEQPISPADKSDLIENTYNAGSIVWAHISGFPWWPGIVNDNPDTFAYYELQKKSIKPVRYYVTFFNEEQLDAAWVHKKNIKPLASHKYSQVIKKTKYFGIEYEQPLKKAYQIALNALPLSILQRLRKYSFLAQYEKFYDTNNNVNRPITQTSEMEIVENSDDERQHSNSSQHITLKEFYLSTRKNQISKQFLS
nr:PWWP domain-containing protein2-like [Osmia lignaria]